MSSRDKARKILKGETVDRVEYPRNVLFQIQDLLKNQKTFKVSVNKMVASNGTTFIVCVDHPDRPEDAKPWDTGRMEVFASSVQEHAEQTKDDWDNFFNNKPRTFGDIK